MGIERIGIVWNNEIVLFHILDGLLKKYPEAIITIFPTCLSAATYQGIDLFLVKNGYRDPSKTDTAYSENGQTYAEMLGKVHNSKVVELLPYTWRKAIQEL